MRSREETGDSGKEKDSRSNFLDVSFLSQREDEKWMRIIVLICEWCGDEWTKWNKIILCLLRSDHFLLTYDSSERKSKFEYFSMCVCG